MTDRLIDVFFYGLFMDSSVLRRSQINAVNPRHAYVDGYALCIGQRATLAPISGARAYGMVFALTHDELEKLYTAPGLEQYQAEAILAYSLEVEGETMPALCYNLCEAPDPGEANVEYTERLRAVLSKLDFPPEYIASIS